MDAEWRERCRADELTSRGEDPPETELIWTLSETLAVVPIDDFREVEGNAAALVREGASAPEVLRQLTLLCEVVASRLDDQRVSVEFVRCAARAAEATAGLLVRRAETRAKIDVLTGLGNRAAYNEDIDGAIRRVLFSGGSVVLVNTDLNGLRVVNNTLSHDYGDVYLKYFAVLLTEVVGGHDARAYHISGDEYYLLFRDASVAETRPIIESLAAQDRCPPMSFGIAEFKAEAELRAELQALADSRMQAMKQSEAEADRFRRTEEWLASEYWDAAQEAFA